MGKARAVTDAAYEDAVTVLNAFAVTEFNGQSSPYDEIIRIINSDIDYYSKYVFASTATSGTTNNGGGTTDNPGGTDTPGTDTPGTDTPGTDTPGTDTPGTDTPGTDTPGTGGGGTGTITPGGGSNPGGLGEN